ncbi:MAG: hypothetical protein AAF543_19510, partial [Pseudomonadota bacterium]
RKTDDPENQHKDDPHNAKQHHPTKTEKTETQTNDPSQYAQDKHQARGESQRLAPLSQRNPLFYLFPRSSP